MNNNCPIADGIFPEVLSDMDGSKKRMRHHLVLKDKKKKAGWFACTSVA